MRKWLIFATVLLAIGAMLTFVIAQSSIGRAIGQASDMRFLEEDCGFNVEYAEPTADQESLLRFLPSEGVLTPLQLSSRGELVSRAALDTMSQYSDWDGLFIKVENVEDEAFNEALVRWTRLQKMQLRGNLGNAAIPPLGGHFDLVGLLLESPNCDSSILPNIAAAPGLQGLSIRPRISDSGLAEVIGNAIHETTRFARQPGNHKCTVYRSEAAGD